MQLCVVVSNENFEGRAFHTATKAIGQCFSYMYVVEAFHTATKAIGQCISYMYVVEAFQTETKAIGQCITRKWWKHFKLQNGPMYYTYVVVVVVY